jgi:CheY-like chemotaxis protein
VTERTHERCPASREAIPRVLILDDETSIRNLLRTIIEGLPIRCQIDEAADGDRALELARRSRPDLALLDIVLPDSGVSGVLVCRELCKDARTRVVVISGQATDEMFNACRSMGAAACMRKPFSAAELSTTLKELLPAP